MISSRNFIILRSSEYSVVKMMTRTKMPLKPWNKLKWISLNCKDYNLKKPKGSMYFYLNQKSRLHNLLPFKALKRRKMIHTNISDKH